MRGTGASSMRRADVCCWAESQTQLTASHHHRAPAKVDGPRKAPNIGSWTVREGKERSVERGGSNSEEKDHFAQNMDKAS